MFRRARRIMYAGPTPFAISRVTSHTQLRLARAIARSPGLQPGDAEQLARDLQIFAHPVRVQILDILTRRSEQVCVCDIESGVPVKQPTVSHHLRLLREAGVVGSERRGQWIYYYVNRTVLDSVRARIELVLRRFQ
jgi:ArsR family transcriptional regulator